MGIMNDQPTVKEHCENWGRKHGIIMTADQQVEELKAKNEALQAENARLKEELKRPIAEDSCPDCGETIYFYTLGPIRCGCGGAELALMVNTTILEE